MHTATLLMVVICTASVGAQTLPVSPRYDSTEASGNDQLAGLGATLRQQFLIAEARLQKAKGKEFTGITFRRDAAIGDALTGGTMNLTIRLCQGPEDPGKALSRFSANQLTKPVVVYSGKVVIPSSPAVPSTNYAPWASQNAFHVNFTSAYRYTGLALCIDLVGIHSPSSGTPFWPVDFEQVNADGQAASIGSGCISKDQQPAVAYAPTENLRVGSTACIISLGRPGTSALFLLGATEQRPPLDLGSMGAPGCFQYLNPMLLLQAGRYIALPTSRYAVVNISGQIPATQGLMGSRFIVQFANNESMLPSTQWTNAAGMTTSNGLALTISSIPPILGMSMVRSYPVGSAASIPSWGTVDVSKAPVMRFTYK